PSGEWWPSTIHCSTAVTAISYGHWTVLSQNWLHMRRIFFTRTTVVTRYMRPLFRLMLPQTTPPQELSVHGRTAPQRGIALAVLAHVHALLRAGRLRGRGPVLHLPLSGFADPRLDQRVQWPHVRHRLVGAEDPAQCPGADADLDRGADPCHPGLPAYRLGGGFLLLPADVHSRA